MTLDPNLQTGSGTPTKPKTPLVIALVLIVLVSAAVLFLRQPGNPTEVLSPSQPDTPTLARGLVVYEKQCATCHGNRGLGDGKSAYLLKPKPRNFSEGVFRLTSSQGGLPDDTMLLKTLRNGMPGSAMPSWAHLPENDLESLVLTVRHLAVEARMADLVADEPDMDAAEAREIAVDVMKTADPVHVPVRPETINPTLGQEIYLKKCASCHDADGRGRTRTDMTDNSSNPIFARDFTLGIFKGGSEPDDLALRITGGMPGSPMPSNSSLNPEELWAVVDHVRQSIKPGAQERVMQVQKSLVVSKVNGELEPDPASTVWTESEPTFVPLMPLWWRNNRVEGVSMQAVHNGSKVAFKLSWKDTRRDDQVQTQATFGDGAALQFSESKTPPLFTMGSKGEEVNIWYWRAARQQAMDHGADAASEPPAGGNAFHQGTTGEALFTNPANHVGNPVAAPYHGSSVEDLNAGGFGTLTSQGPSQQNVLGAAQRNDNESTWEVVFVRTLKAEGERDITLTPGEEIRIAFAIWDGQAGDRNGQKSVTIWHRLTFAK